MADNTNDSGREFESDKPSGEAGKQAQGEWTPPQGQQQQQGQQGEFGKSSERTDETGGSSESEFTGQTDTSLADRTGQQGGIEGTGGQGGESGSGFVGSEGEETGDYLQQREKGSQDQDFAEQGQGATDDDEQSDKPGNPDSF